jgi:hypothetical protein
MKHRTLLTSSLVCLGTVLALGGVAVVAQQQPAAEPKPVAPAPTGLGALSGRPDAPPAEAAAADEPAEGTDLLGAAYENRGAGIAVRPPAGSRTVRKAGGDEIVEFVNEKRRWTLKVMLMTTQNPIGLTTTTGLDGRETLGIMDITKRRVAQALPDGATPEKRFLREDVVNIADGVRSEDPRQRVPNVGMLALRYTKGLERLLGQQAIIQANERMYYLITMVSPGKPLTVTNHDAPGAPAPVAKPEPGPGDEPAETLENADPAERVAVETFRQIIDSVKLLDRSKLKQEQDERLFRTRALFVNLTPARLEAAVVPQQWYRLIRKGKDIGYVYTIEEMADGIPQPNQLRQAKAGAPGGVASGEKGVLVGTRSRILIEDTNTQIDAESWMFVTLNRRHEDWSSLIVTTDRKTGKKDHVTEFGTSDRQEGRSLDTEAAERGIRGDGKNDPNQPPVKTREDFFLNVTHVARGGNAEPVNRALVPWYLPQALSKMLPRLIDHKRALASRTPITYLFAQYVGDSREVMNRYVDVEPLQRVTLAGRVIRAIPIRDRITIDGPVTTHYLSESGAYLGSENPDSDVAVIPTDEKTMKDLWKDADLSRPAEAKLQPSASAVAPARGGATTVPPTSTGAGQSHRPGVAPRTPQPRK